MAKGISGTYNSACAARDTINKQAGKEMVYIVDSATAGFGEGLQAIHASEHRHKHRNGKYKLFAFLDV